MVEFEYVRQEDLEEYRRFCRHHLPAFSRPMPGELWHYTTAQGLIGILESGKIWSTQVACLNDTLEQRYFGNLVHTTVKEMRARNTDPNLTELLRIADDVLTLRDFSSAGHFVACFSEVEDDLGQWRGYGGGECGYAIGFRSDGILQSAGRREGAIVLPMNYNEHTHNSIVNHVVRMGMQYFLHGLQRRVPDPNVWAEKFLEAFSIEMDIFACLIKHPKFASEAERRITTFLNPGEHMQLKFTQKRTLLARHLPLDLSLPTEDKPRLPITRIYIGPSPSQHVSRISVGDLLLKCGYEGVTVELSKAPYRVP